MKHKSHIGGYRLLIAAVLSCLFIPQASAFEVSDNYIFDRNGISVREPAAYRFVQNITGKTLGISDLSSPEDMCIGEDGKLYIADTGNSRVVILDDSLAYAGEIQAFDKNGMADALVSPSGLFLTEDNRLYVTDTDKGRIVVFGPDRQFLREYTLDASSAAELGEDFVYKPRRIAVDHEGRMFVISQNNTNGLIQLDENGDFIGFYGAIQVTLSPWDVLIRMLSTEAHRERQKKAIPTVFSGIDIDDQNFVYGVVSAEGINYNPNVLVQRLNLMGNDVLRREGAWEIIGDVQYVEDERSQMVDIVVRENGVYSTLDSRRRHVFTYDYDGNLLYVLGGAGSQNGTFGAATALDTYNENIFVLDAVYGQVVVFEPTVYGSLINEAVGLQYNRKYAQAHDKWGEILQYSSKSDVAYTGMGKALFSQGEYTESMLYFELARDVGNYSRAYLKQRRIWMDENFYALVLGILGAAGLVTALAIVVRQLRKRKKLAVVTGWIPKSFTYSFYVIVHPFDGFWWLKRERRGSYPTAIAFLALLVVAVTALQKNVGFIVNPARDDQINLFLQMLIVVVPFLLWCICNWSVSTLLEGEGSFRDIFISSAYALLPVLLFSVPALIISHYVSADEMSLYTLLLTIGIVWTLALLLVGSQTTQQFSMTKTIATIIVTLLAMLAIFVLALVFISLIRQFFNFIVMIYRELSLRR